jgi:subtilisin family serine protease
MATLQGTSMAAPHVTGAAAQYLQVNPDAWPSWVENLFVNDATYSVVGDPGPGSQNRLLYSAWIGAPSQTVYRVAISVSNGQYFSASGSGYNCPVQVYANGWTDLTQEGIMSY